MSPAQTIARHAAPEIRAAIKRVVESLEIGDHGLDLAATIHARTWGLKTATASHLQALEYVLGRDLVDRILPLAVGEGSDVATWVRTVCERRLEHLESEVPEPRRRRRP